MCWESILMAFSHLRWCRMIVFNLRWFHCWRSVLRHIGIISTSYIAVQILYVPEPVHWIATSYIPQWRAEAIIMTANKFSSQFWRNKHLPSSLSEWDDDDYSCSCSTAGRKYKMWTIYQYFRLPCCYWRKPDKDYFCTSTLPRNKEVDGFPHLPTPTISGEEKPHKAHHNPAAVGCLNLMIQEWWPVTHVRSAGWRKQLLQTLGFALLAVSGCHLFQDPLSCQVALYSPLLL